MKHGEGKIFQKQWYKMAFKDNWENFDDYMAKYGPDNNFDSYTEHGSIYQFYDGIGFLLKKGRIDLSYIDDNLEHSITLIWEKYGTIIKEYKKQINRHRLFEYLSNKLKKI
jgi:hypothetical protein